MIIAPLSKFPFLIDDPLSYLREVEGLEHIVELTELFKYHKELINKALEEAIKGEKKIDKTLTNMEEIVYSYALIVIASIVNNSRLSNRIAVHLTKRYSKNLTTLKLDELIQIANYVGIPLKIDERNTHTIFIEEKFFRNKVESLKKRYALQLDYTEFLKLTKRLRGEPKYKLTNQLIIDGKVHLALDDKSFIARLIEERFFDYIIEKIDSLSQSDKLNKLLENEEFLEIISKTKQLEPKTMETNERKLFGPIRFEAFPPCIKKIYDSFSGGENLSHHQRFVITAFLGSIGMDKEEIVELFKTLPDYKDKITRYQVEHILGERGSGKRYIPYSCEKMRTVGLCIADCNVKNPLQFYYLNLRRKK